MDKVTCILGPTASGKSGLAVSVCLRLAQQGQKAAIINCDSMQVYREIPILSAQPRDADQQCVPHHLYGCLPATQPCSAALWASQAKDVINQCWAEDVVPILVGGTGLYVKALQEGLSPIPDIPHDIRQAARAKLAEEGHEALGRALQDLDPDDPAPPIDGQRLVRAYEVLTATGQPLRYWQKLPLEGGLEARWQHILLDIDRPVLHDRIHQRFDLMMDQGAMAEVERLMGLGLKSDLPAMKALGIPELIKAQSGALSMDAAVTDAKTATRQYAKRQMTWFRNQLYDSIKITPTGQNAQYSERESDNLCNIIRDF